MSPILTIHAAHRNVGKAFLTANLAVSLAAQGHRVAIIELDFASDLPMLLGRDPVESAQHWITLQQPAPPPQSLWFAVGSGAIAFLATGLDAVTPASGFSLVQRLQSQPQTNLLIQQLTDCIPRLQADYILLETFPGFNEESFLAFALADLLLLVLTPTTQDYQDTAVFVDLAQRLQVSQVALLATQVKPEVDRAQLQASLQATYELPVLGTLETLHPRDRSPYPNLFCQRHPDHPLTQSLQAIALHLQTLTRRAIAPDPSASASN
jgi:MinD-like ATPase involved in chromosome partitioning or flagellar assembly